MTIFQIPEGKVVDSIEFKSGEKAAVLNLRYKEGKPEEKKRVAVLCETKEPTGIYLSNLTGELVVCGRADKPDPSYYVPMKKAESGEFVVIQQDSLRTAITKVESCLSTCVCPGHAIDVAWRELNELFVEPK